MEFYNEYSSFEVIPIFVWDTIEIIEHSVHGGFKQALNMVNDVGAGRAR